MLNAADTMALKAPRYQDYLPNCVVNCDDRGEGDAMKECDVVLMPGRELDPPPCCVYFDDHRRVRSGRPFTHCEGGMPKTQRPGDNRDEVLNPAMERSRSGSSCRQMGRGRVEENTDEYVNYDQNTSCAKESIEKFHFGSHPPGRRACHVRRPGCR